MFGDHLFDTKDLSLLRFELKSATLFHSIKSLDDQIVLEITLLRKICAQFLDLFANIFRRLLRCFILVNSDDISLAFEDFLKVKQPLKILNDLDLLNKS